MSSQTIINCDANVFVQLGGLSVFEEIIWQFPESTVCPLDACGQSFSSQSDSVKHFCEQHAMTAMSCSVCNTLFSAENSTSLQQHYDTNHPDEALPELKSVPPQPDTTVENKTNNKKDYANQKNHSKISTDLIILSGSGYKTQWQMPSNQTRCPVVGCKYPLFVNRKSLISHYKNAHARRSIYCYICEKPIVSPSECKYDDHYRRVHPNVSEPFDFEANKKLPKIPQRKKGRKRNSKEESDDSDLIDLHAFGYHTNSLSDYTLHYSRKHENVKSPFDFANNAELSEVKEKRSPVHGYRTRFSCRTTERPNHIKGTQAKEFVQCGIRNVSATKASCINRHYRTIHPNEKKLPKLSDETKKSTCIKCDICFKNFSTHSILQRHMSEQHKPQKRVHRPMKSRHILNSRRVLLSHRWMRRYYSCIFQKILYQQYRLARVTNNAIHVNQSSVAPVQHSNHIQQNVVENGFVSNNCESEERLLESLTEIESRLPSTEDIDMACRNLKRRNNNSNSNCSNDHHDEAERTNQSQQSTKQKSVSAVEDSAHDGQLNSLQTYQVKMKPTSLIAPPASSSSNFFGGNSKTTKTPIRTDIKPEAIDSMVNNLDDEKPLDLSIVKTMKSIYVMDSDEEAETIVIDSDDDNDDNKEHLQKLLHKS